MIEDIQCRHCGAPGHDICSDCADFHAKKKSICPPLYLKTDPKRLSLKAQSLIDYEYSPKGLAIWGRSGTGKTRVAWLIVNRWIADGKKVACFDALSFSHGVDLQFGNGDGPEWISAICKHDAVFFDDIDKCKFTERVASELFCLVERFAADEKPLIITSNTSGDAFERRFPEHIGGALRRRLREFCRVEGFE